LRKNLELFLSGGDMRKPVGAKLVLQYE